MRSFLRLNRHILLLSLLILPGCAIVPAANQAVPTPQTMGVEVPAYTSTNLHIVREGKTYSILLGVDVGDASFHTTPEPQVNMTKWYGDTSNVVYTNIDRTGDFDGDGEMEVLVTNYARGAVPYLQVAVADYLPETDEYFISDSIGFRGSCFDRIEDLEENGSPEIIAKDNSILTTGPDSAFSPIMILRYDGARFVDVTGSYPLLIEQDANHWLDRILNDPEQEPYSAFFSAYLADMSLLGKMDEGVARYNELCPAKLLSYIKASNPESAFTCEEYLQRIEQAIQKRGELNE